MDIYKEINNLPNFLYEYYDDNEIYHFAILGGHDCQIYEPSNFCDESNRKLARDKKSELEELYGHTALSDKDKTDLANMMIHIQNLCETRTAELSTLAKEKQYIETLSDNEKAQIEKQIQMYKDCRCFYRDYVYKK